MPNTKTKRSPRRGSAKKSKTSRCWAGYEPTPGKKPGSKGSCHKKR